MSGHTSTAMIGKVAQWALAVLGIIFVVMIYLGKDSGIDGGLYVTYTALLLCAGIAVVAAVMGLATAGKRAMPTLIGIGGFLVLVALLYGIAGDTVLPAWQEQGVTPGESKWIGAGLSVMYILLGGAVAAIVIGEISRLLK